MRVKSMRDVVTRRDLIDRAAPTTPAEIVTLLVRAQLEVIRLQSERNVWAGKQEEAERRLQRAAARVESLRRALDAASPTRRKKGARRARPGPVPVRQREVRLEY